MHVHDQQDSSSLEELMNHFGFSPPGPREVFLQLQDAMLGHGVLAQKTKELIALSICITGHREDGISSHVRQALRCGASRAEVLEAIGEAILMGGPMSLPYGQQAADAIERGE